MSPNVRLLLACALPLWLCGCTNLNMEDHSRYKPFEKSSFFEDGDSSRPLVEGVVPRGALKEDDFLYTGKIGGRFVKSFPFAVDRQVVERGRAQFEIYCAVCHNRTGTGDGIVVKRGFKTPPSYHEQRLRDIPEGYLFDVITNGFGDMPRFSPELSAEDRWAIIAYLRALQRSTQVSVDELTDEEKQKLETPDNAR